jgi:hypothetical protein
MKALATASILVVLFVSAASAQVWEPEMHLKLKAVGAPRVSPDGSRIVYTVNEAVTTPDKSEFITQVWMANVATKQSTQLTFGASLRPIPNGHPTASGSRFCQIAKTTETVSIA